MNIGEWFNYNNGHLYWKKFPNNHYSDYSVGDQAGHFSQGRLFVSLFGKSYSATNLIWELHNGSIPVGMLVDHINLNPTDNRIENLRLATNAQNMWNTKLLPSNKTGVKGLSYSKKRNTWIGQIVANGKCHTKQSKDRSIVEKWLIETRKTVHGEFANNGINTPKSS